MKKISVCFFILSTLFFFSDSLLADMVADDSLDFQLYDITTDISTTTINWDITKVKPGEDKWVWSTTYAKVKAQDVPLHVIYYMYQDNKESSVYKAVNFRTEEEDGKIYHRYSGLVNQKKEGGEDKGFIPLSYVFVSSKLKSSDFNKEYDPAISVDGKDMPDGLDRSARYFMDKSDVYIEGEKEKSNFTEKKGYCAIAGWDRTNYYVDNPNKAKGQCPVFWYYDNEWGNEWVCWPSDKVIARGDHTAYMYFGANFKNASKGDVFGTNKIVIEKVFE